MLESQLASRTLRVKPVSVLAPPFLWTLYVVLPVTSWGLLHGIPLGLSGAAVLFAIWWTWTFGVLRPGWRPLVVLIVWKVAVGSTLVVEHGFRANYHANAAWQAPVEQSTEFRSTDFTRIDRRLTFGFPDAPDFPLYFINDVNRFNFYRRGDPDRLRLPFSATWQGDTWAYRAEKQRSFYLRGRGISAELWIDAILVVELKPSDEEATWRAPWHRGRHHLILRVSASDRSVAQLAAGFVNRNGEKIPFDETLFVARSSPTWRVMADRFVRPVTKAIDAVLIGVLAVAFIETSRGLLKKLRRGERIQPLSGLAAVVVMTGGFVFAAPAANALTILGGGHDYLTYESYSRDIGLNGPLMLMGKSIGEAQPYYYQPLYPYFLALVHLFFGEDLSGIYLIQWLLACATVVAVWRITARLFGERIGWAGLVLGGIFFTTRLVPLAGILLTENLFIPLLCAWTLGLIEMASPQRSDRPFLTGLVGGFAALTRSSLIAGWIFLLPLLFFTRRRASKRLIGFGVMVGIMVCVLSLATVRNWIASYTFVPVTSSFEINFYLGNEPPRDIPLKSTGLTDRVIEFARVAPALFLRGLVDKALFTLGFFERRMPGAGSSLLLIATWIGALVGFGALMFTNIPAGVRGAVRALPALLSVSQFLVVTAVFPQGYEDRLVLPLYCLLIPYAAIAAGVALAPGRKCGNSSR